MKALIRYRVNRHAQGPVVVIFERNEPEWLQNPLVEVPCGAKHLCHPVDGPGLGLECNLDKIALAQRFRKS